MAKTSIPTVKIHDLATGEEIERPMNAEELAQLEIDKAIAAEYEAKKAADAEAKAALLARLGITAEEAKTLLA